jgi:hypothetical protein
MEINKDEMLVIGEVKKYSNVFLESMGGFYPFAIVMKKNKQITSVAASDGEEFPDSQSLIDLLERSLSKERRNGKYILAAICIDIFVHDNINGIKTKKNAIEIRLVGTTYQKKVILYYQITEENEVIFQELIGGD